MANGNATVTVTIAVNAAASGGSVSINTLTVNSGTAWRVSSNILTVGQERITATPYSGYELYKFGLTDSSATSGTITANTTFNAYFRLKAPENNGVFRVAQAAKTDLVMDVYGNSTQLNAQIWLYGDSDSPAQKFYCRPGHANGVMMLNQTSNMAWYCNGSDYPHVGQILRQFYSTVTTSECDWVFTRTNTTVRINGVTYYGWKIQWAQDGNTYLDNTNAVLSPSNDIKLQEGNDTLAQRWVLIKDATINRDWQIPGMKISKPSANIPLNTSQSYTLELSGGPVGHYQRRYRYRVMEHNASEWGTWTTWRHEGREVSDEGWGDVWNSNCTSSSQIGVSAASTTAQRDAFQYQIEARSFRKAEATGGLPMVSEKNSLSFVCKQQAVITVGGDSGTTCALTAKGLTIEYSTDVYRTADDMTLTLSNIKCANKPLADDIALTLKGSSINSGSITILYEDLAFAPGDGQKVTLNVKLANTRFVGGVNQNKSLTVTGSGGQLTPTISYHGRLGKYNERIRIGEQDSQAFNVANVSLIYAHDGNQVVHNIQKTGSNYDFFPPINTDYNLFVYIENTSNGRWGAKTFTVTKAGGGGNAPYNWLPRLAIVLTTPASEIEFTMFKSNNPLKKSKDMGGEHLELEGNQYQDWYYSGTQDSKWELTDAVIKKEDKEAIERSINEGYCLLRDESGAYAYCAIKAVNYEKLDRNLITVGITMSELANDFDITVPFEVV